MKKSPWPIPAFLLVSLGLFLQGCQQPEEVETVSVKERIEMFLDDLNDDDDRNDIYKQLHPDIRNAWKDPTVWATTPFDYDTGEPFDLEDMDYGSTSADGVFVSADLLYNGEAISFKMEEDEMDVWYINKILVDSVEWIPDPAASLQSRP